MRALWSDRPIALITCLKKLNVSGAFLKRTVRIVLRRIIALLSSMRPQTCMICYGSRKTKGRAPKASHLRASHPHSPHFRRPHFRIFRVFLVFGLQTFSDPIFCKRGESNFFPILCVFAWGPVVRIAKMQKIRPTGLIS